MQARRIIGALLVAAGGLLVGVHAAETRGTNLLVNGCFNNPYCGDLYCPYTVPSPILDLSHR